jgi:hypothetical protein
MAKNENGGGPTPPTQEQMIGGGPGDGNPQATSHTGQAPTGTPPG